ncbi:hypothetical protein [Streptomyces barringtoniae]|uniref:hypothetical protein n=1 Tax=Streptomyces barringtoniae TaxID=2892029 RepID=UPI001E497D91|nr:hypothetical protein [Streptomyces barringtoniae]MCC5474885.1 hypothetical protein [Streptomyces barringtoniae]
MPSPLPGSSADGPPHIDVVHLARRSSGRADDAVGAWTAYGAGVCTPLRGVGRWRARRDGASGATVPVAVPALCTVNSAVKPPAAAGRSGRGPVFRTPVSRPAGGGEDNPHGIGALVGLLASIAPPRRPGRLSGTRLRPLQVAGTA